MKKEDYFRASRKADRLDLVRWKSARSRPVDLVKIYDIRQDKRELEAVVRARTNEKVRRYMVGLGEASTWEHHFAGTPIVPSAFTGYVRSIAQNRDNSYYVELKSVDQEEYDHERGWHGFTAKAVNVPDCPIRTRRIYEPFIPGRVVQILKIAFCELEVHVEQDYDPDTHRNLIYDQ